MGVGKREDVTDVSQQMVLEQQDANKKKRT